MRLYQLILKVSDDFVPEEMELTASTDAQVEILDEGFIGTKSFAECEEVVSEQSASFSIEPAPDSENAEVSE